MKSEKVLYKLIKGSRNVKFTEMVILLNGLGFNLERVSGSHHIFKKQGIDELINIQNVKGEVKQYQIKQLLSLIEKYSIKIER